jgi:hypothetical protein
MDRTDERLTAEEREAEMKKNLKNLLNAPSDKPVTIDKGHEQSIYDEKKPKPT